MIDRFVDNLFGNPALFVIHLMILIIAIALHEFGHAAMAVMCGDPTPKADGRLTLNPLAHLDPVGTIGIVLMTFGWGKPVMVNPANFRNGRWDDIKVSAAGPAMNLFQAIFYALCINAVVLTGRAHMQVTLDILTYGAVVNIGLMLFNLIPIGPLDGSHILKGLLPLRAAYQYHQFNSSWGMALMFLMLLTGYVGVFIDPVRSVFLHILLRPIT